MLYKHVYFINMHICIVYMTKILIKKEAYHL